MAIDPKVQSTLQVATSANNYGYGARNALPLAEPRQIVIKQGEVPPRNPNYARCLQEWNFYDLSYRGGVRYKDGTDSSGNSTLIRHPMESDKGYTARKSMAAFPNYCKPISDKFIGYIFTNHIGRAGDPKYDEWSKNVDLLGTSLHDFMKNAALQSAVQGVWYVMADTTKASDNQTMAQARAAGNRMVLSNLHPSRVIDWSSDYAELLVRHDDGGKYGCVRLWTRDTVTMATLDDQGKIASIRGAEPHGWKSSPILRISVVGNEQSLICDVAEANKQLFNLDATLGEELMKQTFTTWAFIGVTEKEIGAVEAGGRKVVTVNKPAGDVKLERMAGDPTQSASIREAMKQKIEEIYRIVGVRMPDVDVHGPESGHSLRIRFAETSSLAASMADNAECAEKTVVDLYNEAYGTSISYPEYPDDFDPNDVEREMKLTLDTITNNFPNSVKAEQACQYLRRNFTGLDVNELNALEKEAREFYASQPEGDPGVDPSPKGADNEVKPKQGEKPIVQDRRERESQPPVARSGRANPYKRVDS